MEEFDIFGIVTRGTTSGYSRWWFDRIWLEMVRNRGNGWFPGGWRPERGEIWWFLPVVVGRTRGGGECDTGPVGRRSETTRGRGQRLKQWGRRLWFHLAGVDRYMAEREKVKSLWLLVLVEKEVKRE
ncbi:hypothetical protein HAX54_014999 [Datura stramonium]|uniref:Uncharacterized protein n=1 Tax=Datura stramonium TaxID=4076 RepID=A0ABS8TRD5_DATST|nr:hypothetical protein [Datura stramonium]